MKHIAEIKNRLVIRSRQFLELFVNMFTETAVRMSAGSLFQTLIPLNFIYVSDFPMLYFRTVKLFLFLVLLLWILECFGKILRFKFKHSNMFRDLRFIEIWQLYYFLMFKGLVLVCVSNERQLDYSWPCRPFSASWIFYLLC